MVQTGQHKPGKLKDLAIVNCRTNGELEGNGFKAGTWSGGGERWETILNGVVSRLHYSDYILRIGVEAGDQPGSDT